jgi:hypothetical protein
VQELALSSEVTRYGVMSCLFPRLALVKRRNLPKQFVAIAQQQIVGRARHMGASGGRSACKYLGL